jgi:uncharacterized protein
VKININQILPEGLTLEEDTASATLDLDTDIIRFLGPVNIKANITKVTDVVIVNLTLKVLMSVSCSRCLNEFSIDLNKSLKLNYPVDSSVQTIDLGSDIREEIILDYPVRFLCSPNCKGLCPKCGQNLNQSRCSCEGEK